MFAQALLHGSVTLTLVSPLIVALVLACTFFIRATQEQFERLTYRIVRLLYLFTLSSSVLALVSYLFTGLGHESILFARYQLSKDFALTLRLDFDIYTIVFLFTCTFITTVITFFSYRYLHRDPGYRRFFITISLFVFGMHLILLAGNFDLIFAGWELVGVASFLLIGYFWHRPKAISAACRAYYIYRLTDLGFLISLLITHLFWHDVNVFRDFYESDMNSVLAHISPSWRWLLSLSILIPVLGKSAQFPFSFWLPKAMEGPTHSSAIFYGSLSIHVGVFLLIKTMPIWYFTPGFTILLGIIGLVTALSATLFALVQSNIKGQIGYASVAQVGIMLIELSFGFTTLAFIHMIGNAFLRCFQLLVSSSILTTHLHMQNVVRTFGSLRQFSLPNLLPKALHPSLYIFALNDGYFEYLLKQTIVQPIMKLAVLCNRVIHGHFKVMSRLKKYFSNKRDSSDERVLFRSISPILPVLFIAAIVDVFFQAYVMVRLASLIAGLFLVLGSLGEKKSPLKALVMIIFGNIFAYLSILTHQSGFLYLIGMVASALLAFESLYYIVSRRNVADLLQHHGLHQDFPLAGTILFIGLLGIISFPTSSTFLGEDIVLALSATSGLHYLLMMQLIFIIGGISTIRLYAVLMFGRRDNANKGFSLDFSGTHAFVRVFIFALCNGAAFWLVVG